MLVLSRKPGERILVGHDVKITVIRIGPNSVRIGIDAPNHMNIVREELTIDAADDLSAGTLSGPLTEALAEAGILDIQRH